MTSETSSSDRTERFRAAMAELGQKESTAGREAGLLKLGGILLVVGIVVGIVAFLMAHFTTSSLQQRDALTIAILGVSVSVAGAALFIRYSLARFLRFWMARLVFEQSRDQAGAGSGGS